MTILTLTPFYQMIKINKFKKQTDRLLVVSEKKLYKVDAAKIKVGNVMIVIQNDENQHVNYYHHYPGKEGQDQNAGDEGGGSGAGDRALLWHRG